VGTHSLYSILRTVSAATHVRMDKIKLKGSGREWNKDRIFARHLYVAIAFERSNLSLQKICRYINKNDKYYLEVQKKMDEDPEFLDFVRSFPVKNYGQRNTMEYRKHVEASIRQILNTVCARHHVKWGVAGEKIQYGRRRIVIYEVARELKTKKFKYKEMSLVIGAPVGEIHSIVRSATEDYEAFIRLNKNRSSVSDVGRSDAQKAALAAVREKRIGRQKYYEQKPKPEAPKETVFGLPEALRYVGNRVYIRSDGSLRLDARPATETEIIELGRRMFGIVQAQKMARMVSPV
jgi:hypothetical protein